MAEGGSTNGVPSVFKTVDESFFDLIDCLCGRFAGLSPFEILNRPTREVYDLYADCIIHDRREKNENNVQDIWVTSDTATWH